MAKRGARPPGGTPIVRRTPSARDGTSAVVADGTGWRGDPRKHPDPAMRRAVRDYMALHDGLVPDKVGYLAPERSPPKYLVELGQEDASRYRRVVDDDEDGRPNDAPELYEHGFDAGAGSHIFYDERGRRHLLGGTNKVTERGITDMKRRNRMKGFFGVGKYIPRPNPDYTKGQIMVRGVGLALIAVGANRAMDTLMDPLFTSDRTRSVVKGITGVGLGMLIGQAYPFVGAGFVAAGALEIIQLGYREFALDRWEAMARDRVAAFVASVRGPVTPSTTPTPGATPGQVTQGVPGGTAGPLDWYAGSVQNGAIGQQLDAGSWNGPDPMAIKKQMEYAGYPAGSL